MTIHDVLGQMSIVNTFYAFGMLTMWQVVKVDLKIVRLYIKSR